MNNACLLFEPQRRHLFKGVLIRGGHLFDFLDWFGDSSQIHSNENDKRFAEIMLDRCKERKMRIDINILENILIKFPCNEKIK